MLREKSALVVKIHKGLDIVLTIAAFVGAYLKIPAASYGESSTVGNSVCF